MEEKSTRLSANPIIPKGREREREQDKNESKEKPGILTLKENSRFSPPQTSIPVSYDPRYSKYFLLTANSPPAIVGDLEECDVHISM